VQQHRGCKIHLALAIITNQSVDDASFSPKPAEQLTNEYGFFPTSFSKSAGIKVGETDVLVRWKDIALEYAKENLHCFYFGKR
jgi:hypothetical protein